MNFKTDIVKTWEPGWPLRILMLILFLGSGYVLFVSEDEPGRLLKIFAGLCYVAGLFIALGRSFFKSKKIGNFEIGSSEMAVKIGEDQRVFPLSQVREITLKYSGYGSWKSHSIYGNKNFVLLTTQEGELLQFEILIKNKEHKKVLKEIFAEESCSVAFYPIKIGGAEF